MATRKFKFKHIAASASTHVGDAGELILDTATNTLKVSDGSTPGGVAVNGTSTVADTDGGAIDLTKDIVFIKNGQSYTLADGSVAGQKITFVISTGTTGALTIVVANAAYLGSGTLTTATNYNWVFNSGGGIPNTAALRYCVWSGSKWILDNA